MNRDRLQNLIDNFATQLIEFCREELLAALGGSVSAAPRGSLPMVMVKMDGPRPTVQDHARANGHRSSNGTNGRKGLAKGEKRSTEALEELSEKFAAFVAKNPGLRIEQINTQLGTTTKELALPIRKLLGEKRIKSKGEKRSTTYHA
jgi:hypothetical protein